MDMNPNTGARQPEQRQQPAPPPTYAPPPPPPYGYPAGQPYAPPRAAYPPFRAPAPPPFVMPTDPAKPIQVVASRKLNAAQFRGAYKAISGAKPTLLLLLLLALNLVPAVSVAVGCRLYPKTWETYLFAGIMGTALVAGLAAALLYRRWLSRRTEKALAAYQDGEPPEGVIELYADRVVRVSAASVEVIPFAQVNLLAETGDTILIGRPGRFIAWRAEDLTPYDAQLLTACLQMKIRPGYHRRTAPFYPWLREPLPLPVVRGEDPVWLNVGVPAADNHSLSAAFQNNTVTFWALLPAAVMMAGSMAIFAYITPYLLLDLLLYSLLGAVVLAALYVLAVAVLDGFRPMGLVGRGEAVEYAFTPKGMAVKLRDCVRFVDKRHITARSGKKAVRLKTPCDTFIIPWKAVGKPETLKKILSL